MKVRQIVTPPTCPDIGKISIMNSSFLAIQTGHAQLKRLIALRTTAVIAQCAMLALVHFVLEITLSWLPMLTCIALLVVFNYLPNYA